MAKGRAYDNLYARLETKEGEKELYRLARPVVPNLFSVKNPFDNMVKTCGPLK